MVDRTSLFKLSGLPESFGAIILIFSFILLLAPYFSGADFGIFKIPTFTSSAKKWLKIIGPLLSTVCIVSYLPIIPTATMQETTCPQIEGSWQRQTTEDGTIIKIEQSGCEITSTTETYAESNNFKQQL
ncbi:MAG TPA: hypothetical protein VE732_06690, partial [Nitrososphaera sp.]|nr:hypothetical protein [Nitrososphaera sp.]